MGTRNTLKVTYNGKRMIDNYGQWDGYPTGQGREVLHFMESDHNIMHLIHAFEYHSPELTDAGTLYDLISKVDGCVKNADEKVRNMYGQMVANSLFSRDWGCSILYAIAYGNKPYGVQMLPDNGVDAWGGQEGNYQIDITKTEDGEISAIITMEYQGYVRTYNLDNMPRGKAIDEEMKAWEEKINNCEE